MRKHVFLAAFVALFAMGAEAAPQIQRAEPLNWWTGMHTQLTLMLQGQDLADAKVEIHLLKDGVPERCKAKGLTVRGQHNAESKNYLFVDLNVKRAGTYRITLTKDGQQASWDYQIREREKGDGKEGRRGCP